MILFHTCVLKIFLKLSICSCPFILGGIEKQDIWRMDKVPDIYLFKLFPQCQYREQNNKKGKKNVHNVPIYKFQTRKHLLKKKQFKNNNIMITVNNITNYYNIIK